MFSDDRLTWLSEDRVLGEASHFHGFDQEIVNRCKVSSREGVQVFKALSQ